jgi:hypothetical protein
VLLWREGAILISAPCCTREAKAAVAVAPGPIRYVLSGKATWVHGSVRVRDGLHWALKHLCEKETPKRVPVGYPTGRYIVRVPVWVWEKKGTVEIATDMRLANRTSEVCWDATVAKISAWWIA